MIWLVPYVLAFAMFDDRSSENASELLLNPDNVHRYVNEWRSEGVKVTYTNTQ